MFERLKICWFVLTKKHYAAFFYSQKKLGKSGAACYMDETSSKDDWFYNVCFEYWKKVLKDMKLLENIKSKCEK